jgi:hypothetical protein
VVLDGDNRVFVVGRNAIERDILTLIVETKPWTAVAVIEDSIADAAIEPVNSPGVTGDPDPRHHENDEHGADCPENSPPTDG